MGGDLGHAVSRFEVIHIKEHLERRNVFAAALLDELADILTQWPGICRTGSSSVEGTLRGTHGKI